MQTVNNFSFEMQRTENVIPLSTEFIGKTKIRKTTVFILLGWF